MDGRKYISCTLIGVIMTIFIVTSTACDRFPIMLFNFEVMAQGKLANPYKPFHTGD